VTQTFINDLHPWTTLLGVAAIGLCALDVAIRQGKGTYSKKVICKNCSFSILYISECAYNFYIYTVLWLQIIGN
jgi:hypothetical protein